MMTNMFTLFSCKGAIRNYRYHDDDHDDDGGGGGGSDDDDPHVHPLFL